MVSNELVAQHPLKINRGQRDKTDDEAKPSHVFSPCAWFATDEYKKRRDRNDEQNK